MKIFFNSQVKKFNIHPGKVLYPDSFFLHLWRSHSTPRTIIFAFKMDIFNLHNGDNLHPERKYLSSYAYCERSPWDLRMVELSPTAPWTVPPMKLAARTQRNHADIEKSSSICWLINALQKSQRSKSVFISISAGSAVLTNHQFSTFRKVII